MLAGGYGAAAWGTPAAAPAMGGYGYGYDPSAAAAAAGGVYGA